MSPHIPNTSHHPTVKQARIQLLVHEPADQHPIRSTSTPAYSIMTGAAQQATDIQT